MAITADEKHLIFEVFGIPNDVSVLYIDGAFGTGKHFETGAILVTKSLIDARLDALTGSPLTRLQELLVSWKKVAISGTRLRPVNSNQGVDRNPARDRALIRERIRMIVPIILKQGPTNPGGSIPLG